MGKKSVRVIVLFSVLAIALGLMFLGCEKKPELTGTIKIGVAAPMSGDAAAYGEVIYNGAMMKVEEINAAGGVNGATLELVVGDELCDPKEAAIVAQNFVNDPAILAVVGHVCSSAMLAAIPYYKEAGLCAVSPTATNVTIGVVGEGWMFRDVYRDDFQGKFMAEYTKNVLGITKVGVFYENNDYALGLKDAFVAAATEIGLEIVGEEAYTTGTTDFNPQLTKFKELAPEAIFIAGYYQEGGLILSQAKKLGLNVQFMGADGLNNPELINIAKDAAEGFLASSPLVFEVAGDEALKFKADFEAKYGSTPDWMAANAYDAVGIIAKAIEDCGADRAKIRECLAGMNSANKGYEGITGVTFFDANGDCQKPAYVNLVKDGVFVAAEKQMLE